MKRVLVWTAIMAGVGLGGAAAVGGGQDAGGKSAAINVTCPISGKAIDGESFVEFRGRRIGVCCEKCQRRFANLSDRRKADYVASLGALGDAVPADPAASPPANPTTRPARATVPGAAALYTLATCPVSGQKLDVMGEPVIKVYDGREVRFCCEKCIGKFEASPAEYFQKIDAKLIERQRAFYPLTICPVSGKALGGDDGADEIVERVIGNRLVRFCCKSCVRKARTEPGLYLASLDAAIREQQGKAYPLATCPVSGNTLGEMGPPVEAIVGNRLVRFCCKSCRPEFAKNPPKYLALVEAAWKTRQRGPGHDAGGAARSE